ncbi:MAG: hypothetical protein K2G30_00775 [Muribaculaceae bacterium]|nr:hypothetical protein [Muribaculaceae bacterium]MDE7142980.1 hypothetical protein [Muribaculaceae bacterium]
MIDNNVELTPLPSPLETATCRRKLTIGLPKCLTLSERRFPLTPEAARNLTERGFCLLMEPGAAESIHYPDGAYSKGGVRFVTRRETLQADIVIHLAPLAVPDIAQLRKGALLLTLANFGRREGQEVVRRLLDRRVINIAIDLIVDSYGHRPFADVMAEVSGRAAVTIASGMMADSDLGKGILMGGVAGVSPCEVVILGSDLAASAAARSALGLGAMVRMFDSDVYRLRASLRQIGGGVIGSSIHPRALENALRTADVVISTDLDCPVVVEASGETLLKRGVLVFDLSSEPGRAFPTMPLCDLGENVARPSAGLRPGEPSSCHTCYCNAGSAVPRTAAMALSDTFITMLDDIAGCEGASSAIQLTPGLQDAALTFLGKAVNPRVARIAGVRHYDIRLLLSLS